ncbi:hypothetical protein Q7C36_006331 [Tachysurus vachellii]|uniref:Uncharacterized protein n=1 Tax=Tachysurus vachellii TaxID=175792 RepID=A0AA88SWL8_TACVA|nr:hypothetical protein Q7C36_006331 [Tachysurus vachellii]
MAQTACQTAYFVLPLLQVILYPLGLGHAVPHQGVQLGSQFTCPLSILSQPITTEAGTRAVAQQFLNVIPVTLVSVQFLSSAAAKTSMPTTYTLFRVPECWIIFQARSIAITLHCAFTSVANHDHG